MQQKRAKKKYFKKCNYTLDKIRNIVLYFKGNIKIAFEPSKLAYKKLYKKV